MNVIADSDIERALVITAHPDDVDFAAAGTVAAWSAMGTDVSYCVVTDGQAGGFDRDLDRSDIPGIRRAEQQRAGAHVGVTDLHFLGYVDGELTVSRELIRDLTRVVRQVRPQRVLIQSPERDWSRLAPSHPDHLVSGEASIQALYPAAGNPFAFQELIDEGVEPWSAEEVWVMEHPSSNHAVDVTEHFDAKMSALLSHESQHADPERLHELMRTALSATAVEFGLEPGHLAERYAVYPLP